MASLPPCKRHNEILPANIERAALAGQPLCIGALKVWALWQLDSPLFRTLTLLMRGGHGRAKKEKRR